MIRRMKPADREAYYHLAEAFYSTDAILSDPDQALFCATFEEMMKRDTYLMGFMLERGGQSAGYGILAKGFSTELGGPVIWVEELFIKKEYRSQGLGSDFFAYVQDTFGIRAKRLCLEVEPDNKKAISLYRSLGFEKLPYTQMSMKLTA